MGAAFLTLIPLFRVRYFKGHFANTFLGALLGHLWVFAPIARGMHEAGTRIETTLATMISSPTLNVIMLIMMFTLLPLRFVVQKLIFTLALSYFLSHC